jgi:hypothetical protein
MTVKQNEELFNAAPGSPLARAHGCVCTPQNTGMDIFSADPECPVHGLDALAAILQNDDQKRKSPP